MTLSRNSSLTSALVFSRTKPAVPIYQTFELLGSELPDAVFCGRGFCDVGPLQTRPAVPWPCPGWSGEWHGDLTLCQRKG